MGVGFYLEAVSAAISVWSKTKCGFKWHFLCLQFSQVLNLPPAAKEAATTAGGSGSIWKRLLREYFRLPEASAN